MCALPTTEVILFGVLITACPVLVIMVCRQSEGGLKFFFSHYLLAVFHGKNLPFYCFQWVNLFLPRGEGGNDVNNLATSMKTEVLVTGEFIGEKESNLKGGAWKSALPILR